MLGVFRNTLTSYDKYPVGDCVNLLYPIQMQLSLKTTIFSDFFVAFLEPTSNSKHFEKKDDSDSHFTWEIRHCERVG